MHEKLEQEIVSQRASSMDTGRNVDRYAPEVLTAKELLKQDEAPGGSFFTDDSSQMPEINSGDQEMPSVDICPEGLDDAPNVVNQTDGCFLFRQQERREGSTSNFFTAQSSEPPDMQAIDDELASIDICGGEKLDLEDVYDESPCEEQDEENVRRFFTAATAQPPVLNIDEQDIPSVDECGGEDLIQMEDDQCMAMDEPVWQGNFHELFTAETSKPPLVSIHEEEILSVDTTDAKYDHGIASKDSCVENDQHHGVKIHKSKSVRNGLSLLGDITFENYFTLTSSRPLVNNSPDIKTHSINVFGGADYDDHNQTKFWVNTEITGKVYNFLNTSK